MAALVAAALLASTPAANAGRPRKAPPKRQRFDQLQRQMRRRPETIAPGARRSRIVVPSLSLDPRELAKITGARHYEERQLYEVFGLRDPKLRLVYTSSTPIDRDVVNYYLGLLPASQQKSARKRLQFVTADDAAVTPLSEKILTRPELRREVKRASGRKGRGRHVHPFVSSGLERDLSASLGAGMLGTDPALARWGGKSGGRELFEVAGVSHPDGARDLMDHHQVVAAISDLVARRPAIQRVVVKLNDGFSGEGNAILDLRATRGLGKLPAAERRKRIAALLPGLEFTAPTERWPTFRKSIGEMGAIVEEFIEGDVKESPSVQGFIHPDGRVEILSTHEQILGGPGNQVYLGARFPANEPYRAELQRIGRAVGKQLAAKGAMGRFAVDTIATPRPGSARWDLHAIEINLRQGGTTHPYETTRLLTGATLDEATGYLVTKKGQPKFYVATDNVKLDGLVGLTPGELLRRAKRAGLRYEQLAQRGPVFHLLGAVTEHGKLGFTAIGDTPAEAQAIYDHTMKALEAIAAGE
ncbi:MAG TPA: peptide ligase PGM1-related protein [Kofleriaceae bacterium]|nr:peptide ligase PGM1-related protein [Kofleriaceae bacterium]